MCDGYDNNNDRFQINLKRDSIEDVVNFILEIHEGEYVLILVKINYKTAKDLEENLPSTMLAGLPRDGNCKH